MAFGKKKDKSPPIFSHEFVIKNHGDIFSFVLMIFLCGLMLKATQPWAQLFIGMQHNLTNMDELRRGESMQYSYGLKDLLSIFFYTNAWIVFQAVVHEYFVEKMVKRYHMSRSKTRQFIESGNLLPGLLVFAVWAGDIIFNQEQFVPRISSLWQGYPHIALSFQLKLFFILLTSYWLHMYPDLYFLKAKQEEIWPRIQQYTLHVIAVVCAYCLNFTRVAICLCFIHFVPEILYHTSRLLYNAGKKGIAQHGFFLWSILFVVARVLSVVLSIWTFWFGLGSAAESTFDVPTGNFNSCTVRITCLVGAVFLQCGLAWDFIVFQLNRKTMEKSDESETVSILKPLSESPESTPRQRKAKTSSAENTPKKGKPKKD